MCWPQLIPIAAVLWLFVAPVAAEPQTVCTITVNSADEKEAFRRHLPASSYRFVELVERGRPDWLASACHSDISCDVLVVSGHFDGHSAFFSDRLEVQEFLPVAELERVSCNGACPGLFSRLKEVHLFGCNTLNPAPQGSASAEIVRGLVREGHSRQEAERQLKSLNGSAGESSRERMRQIFHGVPVIYGFSSTAPLGPLAASTRDRYFRSSGPHEIGRGHPSGRLLGAFAPLALSVTPGLGDQDPLAGARRDMCRFADDRLPLADKIGFVHSLLQRHSGESRLYLDRIQRLAGELDEAARQVPEVRRALDTLAQDSSTRARFLDSARAAEPPEVRVRLLDLARDLGWLSADAHWNELALMLADLQARRSIDVAEVDLACTLNQNHELDGAFSRRIAAGGPLDDLPHAAIRACLGSAEGHARTLAGLSGGHEADARIAQTYLRHRPLTDIGELRQAADGIVRMKPSEAQVRALEALGRHYLSDREILEALTRLFAETPSAAVQDAIAGILLRADRRSIANPQLLATLRERRRPSTGGDPMIDALMHRLQQP